MELQTIRQKLQTLKASPPETVAAPWGQPRLAAPSPNLAQVTTAIETLRQRSQQTVDQKTPETSLQRFDAALSTIENLAQQQQQTLQQLQALGHSLIQHSQPGTSPDVDHIARFLNECQTIHIPTILRDRNGYIELAHHTVKLTQAELSHNQLFQGPQKQFQHQDSGFTAPHYTDVDSGSLLDDLGHFCHIAYRSIQSWVKQYLPPVTPRSRTSQFTLVDGTIWCIGAAIARIILNQFFRLYPPLWTPVACILIGGIVLNLYRAIFSPRPNPVLGYRTLMIIFGLLLGGHFS